jgi:hypothetical protein
MRINGDNPAVIQVADTYQDLGATIASPDADEKPRPGILPLRLRLQPPHNRAVR